LNNHPLKELREKVALCVHSSSWKLAILFSIVLEIASNTPIFKHDSKAGHFCKIFIYYDLVEGENLKENHFGMK
jgi:hypothetical protein